MQINYTEARVICTASEFSLLTEAKPTEVARMDAPALKKKAGQARKLSDKWRQQSQKQGNPKDGSAARSLRKHELFKEALARFEARLAKVGAPPAKKQATKKKAVDAKAPAKKVPAKKAATKVAKVPAPAKDPRASSSGGLAKQAKQKAIGTNLRISASGQNSRIRGHVAAAGRRNQAARSSRKRS